MSPNIQLLDVVALTADLPDKGLLRGQVGTVVEILAPGVFEVEFADDARKHAMRPGAHHQPLRRATLIAKLFLAEVRL
jgi:hypothetical protein